MVTVETLNVRPIEQNFAAQIEVTFSMRMGVPMKQVPNMLADIEYRFDEEGFAIRITDVPVYYSSRADRFTVHAQIAKVLHRQLSEYVETVRHQRVARDGTAHEVDVQLSEDVEAVRPQRQRRAARHIPYRLRVSARTLINAA